MQKWLFNSSGEIFSLMTEQACDFFFFLVKRLIVFHVPLESLLLEFFLGIADHVGDFIPVSFIFIKAI